MASRASSTNRLDPASAVFLEENESKVSVSMDKFVSNCANVTIKKEDHTIGNLLANQLLFDPEVTFSAYNIQHPLKQELVLRVQTSADIDPFNAIENSILALKKTFSNMQQAFE